MFYLGTLASPINIDSTNPGKKAEVSVPSNPSTVSIQQLQEENNQLKAKLASLENKFEDEKGRFNYQMTMVNMVSRLEDHKKAEKLEDLNSVIGFNQMMTNILLQIKGQGPM